MKMTVLERRFIDRGGCHVHVETTDKKWRGVCVSRNSTARLQRSGQATRW
jgi:hypothetical protein